MLLRIAAPLCLSALLLTAAAPSRHGRINAPGYVAELETFTCPIDGHQFRSPVTQSYTDAGLRRDLAQINGEGRFYEHQIHQCPRCHFSGLQSDYDEISHDHKERIAKYLRKNFFRKLDQVQENICAAKMHQLLGENEPAQASLYLYASYLLRDKPERDAERLAYQLKAAELYLAQTFGTDAESLKEKATATYLAAELYRRAGRFDLATELYSQADNVAAKPAWLPALIEEQSLLAQQRNDDNNL